MKRELKLPSKYLAIRDVASFNKKTKGQKTKRRFFPATVPESGQSARMADGSQNQIPGLIRNKTMNDEQAQAIRNELKRFAGDLNLSDEQKTKLHERLAFAAGRLHEYKKSHPEVTRQDIIKAIGSRRTELREVSRDDGNTKWLARSFRAGYWIQRIWGGRSMAERLPLRVRD
jgi:hypothetical protein